MKYYLPQIHKWLEFPVVEVSQSIQELVHGDVFPGVRFRHVPHGGAVVSLKAHVPQLLLRIPDLLQQALFLQLPHALKVLRGVRLLKERRHQKSLLAYFQGDGEVLLQGLAGALHVLGHFGGVEDGPDSFGLVRQVGEVVVEDGVDEPQHVVDALQLLHGERCGPAGAVLHVTGDPAARSAGDGNLVLNIMPGYQECQSGRSGLVFESILPDSHPAFQGVQSFYF